MLIIAIILLGMIAGAGAQRIIRPGTATNWPQAFATGIAGSLLMGLFFSFLAGDGLELRLSGIVGAIFGATVVTLLWEWFQKSRAPKQQEPPRPHV